MKSSGKADRPAPPLHSSGSGKQESEKHPKTVNGKIQDVSSTPNGAEPSTPTTPPKKIEGNKVETTQKDKQNGEKHGVKKSSNFTGLQKAMSKQPKSEQIAKNQEVSNAPAIPATPQTIREDEQNEKEDVLLPPSTAETPPPVNGKPGKFLTHSGQLPTPSLNFASSKPSAPLTEPPMPAEPSTEPQKDLEQPTEPPEDLEQPTALLPPNATENITADVPTDQVSSVTGQNLPQTFYIPSIQNDDVHEFKKTDIVFKNSDVILFLQNGEKQAKGTEVSPSSSKQIDVVPHPSIEDLRELYRDQKLCDLTISIKEGPGVKLHKIALTANSKKYLALLKQHQNENQPAAIEVQNVSLATLLAVVDFLYEKDIGLTEDNVEDVLNCAMQLDVMSLVKQCVKFLNNVTPENVFNHLGISAKHAAALPKYSLGQMTDIATEMFGQLMDTKAFLILSVEAFMLLLQKEEMHSKGEDVLLRSAVRWLNHDLPRRKTVAGQLLGNIRLNKSSPKLIEELIEENEELSQQPEVKSLLYQAYRYHALHPKCAVGAAAKRDTA